MLHASLSVSLQALIKVRKKIGLQCVKCFQFRAVCMCEFRLYRRYCDMHLAYSNKIGKGVLHSVVPRIPKRPCLQLIKLT
jgi:hypothetical protein